MPLAAGTRLGPYEVIAPLGSGGMGEVYRARDTRLDRQVALKVLPLDKNTDAERKLRFFQEAKAASALNHPNIVTVYDIGFEGGADYIAMELVPGKTLERLIPRHGMQMGELLKCAVQVAEALACAHQASIVHRDLKPSNLIVTPEGLTKVLDFGLAKSVPPTTAGGDGATRTIHALTGDGTAVGTPFYMSPEQAEAKPVDARSDIFSFGAVLYEMATGQRAFRGGSQAAVLAAVLREEPKSASELREELPGELVRIVNRCLRKDPARRFQHMADLKVALEELREENQSGTLTAAAPISSSKTWSKLAVWLIAALAVATGLAFAAFLFLRPSTGGSTDEDWKPVPLTSYPGNEDYASFSPDGNQVTFSWNGQDQKNYSVYVKLIGPGAPLRLTTGTLDDLYPSWSPDGRSIAFLRVDAVTNSIAPIVIPALGGPERRLGTFVYVTRYTGIGPAGLCWTRDSKAIIISAGVSSASQHRLILIPVDGSPPKELTSPTGSDFGDGLPALSEDGQRLAFVKLSSARSRLSVAPFPNLTATAPIEISSNEYVSRLAWMPDSREIIVTTGLSAQTSHLDRVDARAGAKLRAIAGLGPGSINPAISGKAKRLVFTRGNVDGNFWDVDLATRTATLDRGLSSSFRDAFPQISSDGSRVVFYSNRGGSHQIWTANRDGTQAVQLTNLNGATTGSPRWSPNGQQIVFDSNSGGAYQTYIMSADGGGVRLLVDDRPAFAPNWSRDGKWIYFSSMRSGDYQVWKLPAQGGQAVPVTHQGGVGPVESPDGKFVYFSKQAGNGGLWRVPADGGEEKQILPDVFRVNYVVTEDGIYYIPRPGHDKSTSIQYLKFSTGKTEEIITINKTIDLGLGISPDGRTLIYCQIDYEGRDLMLVENFH